MSRGSMLLFVSPSIISTSPPSPHTPLLTLIKESEYLCSEIRQLKITHRDVLTSSPPLQLYMTVKMRLQLMDDGWSFCVWCFLDGLSSQWSIFGNVTVDMIVIIIVSVLMIFKSLVIYRSLMINHLFLFVLYSAWWKYYLLFTLW